MDVQRMGNTGDFVPMGPFGGLQGHMHWMIGCLSRLIGGLVGSPHGWLAG